MNEFIHFIQNVSTINGLLNTINIWEEIAYFYNDTDLPIELHYSCKNEDINYVKDVLNITDNETYNTEPFPDSAICSAIIKDDSNELLEVYKDGISEKIQTFHVVITLQNNSKKYEFGANAIKESMAHIFENSLIPKNKYELSKSSPYDLVEAIIANNYPILLKPSFMYAMCDASLMYINPAEVFKYMMEKMIFTKFVPSKSIDIYVFFKNNIKSLYPKLDMDFYDYWKNILEKTLKAAGNIVNTSDYEFSYRWLSDLIFEYNCLRKKTPDFFAELCEFKTEKERLGVFLKFMNKKTSPLLINKNNIVSYIGSLKLSKENEKQLFYWHDMSQMYYYIFKNSAECPYYICTENCKFKKQPYKKPINTKSKISFLCKLKYSFLFLIYKLFKIFNNHVPCVFSQYSRMFGLYTWNSVFEYILATTRLLN